MHSTATFVSSDSAAGGGGGMLGPTAAQQSTPRYPGRQMHPWAVHSPSGVQQRRGQRGTFRKYGVCGAQDPFTTQSPPIIAPRATPS